MAIVLESNKEMVNPIDSTPSISPASDIRFWGALKRRIDSLQKGQKISGNPALVVGDTESSKLLRENSLLLLRGFDSIGSSLSQLTGNLDAALQGANELSKPKLSELYQRDIEPQEDEIERPLTKRRCDDSSQGSKDVSPIKTKQSPTKEDVSPIKTEVLASGKMKETRKIAAKMASKAASLAQELKSIKGEVGYLSERCVLLEEENKRLRDGFSKGIRPEEDDLVRLQLEALLAEKSRLANENANLKRENQCLHQLVEYHQLTSQGLSPSDPEFRGVCLDFSSPHQSMTSSDEVRGEEDDEGTGHRTPRTDIFSFSSSLDECSDEE
ncbi:hypothetical protein AMTRI_Chr08g207170 [Amborella trichopoda]|uniref:Uncharacterized protein n=1 Tax=Amborella trichopoda TaxID=13333 RepID=W1NIV0_AMBTC|nr:uncharacterized protein LOC18423593 [Amborella trichopoda]ERM95672.1 hypothetical protein AMTR_s00023p00204600 [Amborella trichopoda]|eukprot:XP_006828256.1 uncharacterized protein LOC18423593 [Amborella trichopoda]